MRQTQVKTPRIKMIKTMLNQSSKDRGKLGRTSSIAAICIISESELIKVMPEYDYTFSQTEGFKTGTLFELGIDTSKTVLEQNAIQHRNRFGEIVVCTRWVGAERTDADWINSGYASQEAMDKASGSRILEDIYRAKYLTEDAQAMLEARDRYAVVEEEPEQKTNKSNKKGK